MQEQNGQETLGDRIGRLRRARGIRQGALGAALGTTQSVVSRIERGAIELPAARLGAVAAALDVSVVELLGVRAIDVRLLEQVLRALRAGLGDREIDPGKEARLIEALYAEGLTDGAIAEGSVERLLAIAL